MIAEFICFAGGTALGYFVSQYRNKLLRIKEGVQKVMQDELKK